MNSDLFDQARRRVRIEDDQWTKLYGASNRRRGVCPLCAQGKGQKTGFAYEVNVLKQRFRCYSCDAHGDVITLEQLLRGGTSGDAARRLIGDGPLMPLPPRHEPEVQVVDETDLAKLKYAKEIWGESQGAHHSLVQRYLVHRGLYGSVLLEMLKHLRFHPRVFYSRGRSFPAMLAKPETPMGPVGGVQAVYLARDGMGKAWVEKHETAKKMWGPQTDATGCPGGVWLRAIPKDGPGKGVLAICEGIETTASLGCLLDEPCGLVAALSLHRLQGRVLKDRYGRFDPAVPVPDPEHGAFTWPGVRRAIIGVDHDMRPVKFKMRAPHGGTVERLLDATARAQLCGTLAVAAWRRAGAEVAEVKCPPLDMDFNDVLRERIGA